LIDADKLRRDVLPMADERTRSDLEKILDSDLKMLRAHYLKKGKEQKVYNLTVEGNHNYLVFTDAYVPVVVANSHASIVSRELGIPCVVGTGTATTTLKTGQVVTVDGAKGAVYKGKVELAASNPTSSAVQVSSPQSMALGCFEPNLLSLALANTRKP
jgi:phosphoenolpyruvate synthase/pyruvate phosphate dikinase